MRTEYGVRLYAPILIAALFMLAASVVHAQDAPALPNPDSSVDTTICTDGDYQCVYPGHDAAGKQCMQGKTCNETGIEDGGCTSKGICKAKCVMIDGACKTPQKPNVPAQGTTGSQTPTTPASGAAQPASPGTPSNTQVGNAFQNPGQDISKPSVSAGASLLEDAIIWSEFEGESLAPPDTSVTDTAGLDQVAPASVVDTSAAQGGLNPGTEYTGAQGALQTANDQGLIPGNPAGDVVPGAPSTFGTPNENGTPAETAANPAEQPAASCDSGVVCAMKNAASEVATEVKAAVTNAGNALADAFSIGSAEAKPGAQMIQDAAQGTTISGMATEYNPLKPGESSGGTGLATGGTYSATDYTAAIQTDIGQATGCGVGGGTVCYAQVDYGGKSLIVAIPDNGPLSGNGIPDNPTRIIDLNQASMDYLSGVPNSSNVSLEGVKVTMLQGSDYTPGPVLLNTGGGIGGEINAPLNVQQPFSDANSEFFGSSVGTAASPSDEAATFAAEQKALNSNNVNTMITPSPTPEQLQTLANNTVSAQPQLSNPYAGSQGLSGGSAPGPEAFAGPTIEPANPAPVAQVAGGEALPPAVETGANIPVPDTSLADQSGKSITDQVRAAAVSGEPSNWTNLTNNVSGIASNVGQTVQGWWSSLSGGNATPAESYGGELALGQSGEAQPAGIAPQDQGSAIPPQSNGVPYSPPNITGVDLTPPEPLVAAPVLPMTSDTLPILDDQPASTLTGSHYDQAGNVITAAPNGDVTITQPNGTESFVPKSDVGNLTVGALAMQVSAGEVPGIPPQPTYLLGDDGQPLLDANNKPILAGDTATLLATAKAEEAQGAANFPEVTQQPASAPAPTYVLGDDGKPLLDTQGNPIKEGDNATLLATVKTEEAQGAANYPPTPTQLPPPPDSISCPSGYNCMAADKALRNEYATLQSQITASNVLIQQYRSGDSLVMQGAGVDTPTILSSDQAIAMTQEQANELQAKADSTARDIAAVEAGNITGASSQAQNAAVLATQGQGSWSSGLSNFSAGARDLGASLFTLSSSDEAKAAQLQQSASDNCGSACVIALKVNDYVPIVGGAVRLAGDLGAAVADGVNAGGAMLNNATGGALPIFNQGVDQSAQCAISGCVTQQSVAIGTGALAAWGGAAIVKEGIAFTADAFSSALPTATWNAESSAIAAGARIESSEVLATDVVGATAIEDTAIAAPSGANSTAAVTGDSSAAASGAGTDLSVARPAVQDVGEARNILAEAEQSAASVQPTQAYAASDWTGGAEFEAKGFQNSAFAEPTPPVVEPNPSLGTGPGTPTASAEPVPTATAEPLASNSTDLNVRPGTQEVPNTNLAADIKEPAPGANPGAADAAPQTTPPPAAETPSSSVAPKTDVPPASETPPPVEPVEPVEPVVKPGEVPEATAPGAKSGTEPATVEPPANPESPTTVRPVDEPPIKPIEPASAPTEPLTPQTWRQWAAQQWSDLTTGKLFSTDAAATEATAESKVATDALTGVNRYYFSPTQQLEAEFAGIAQRVPTVAAPAETGASVSGAASAGALNPLNTTGAKVTTGAGLALITGLNYFGPKPGTPATSATTPAPTETPSVYKQALANIDAVAAVVKLDTSATLSADAAARARLGLSNGNLTGGNQQNTGNNAGSGSGSSSGLSGLMSSIGQLLAKALGQQSTPAAASAPAATTPTTPTTPLAIAPTPIVTLVANPTTVAASSTAQLAWSAVGVTQCNITDQNNNLIGQGNPDGSTTTPPLLVTTSFIANCTSPGGATGSATTTVTVQ